ncbi:jg27226, partial [Pararge aegeria aegeria]
AARSPGGGVVASKGGGGEWRGAAVTLLCVQDAAAAEQTRDKRKFEGVTEAKFGIKNAVLGFVFGKINSLIDSKTRLVENLDRQNIEINKQYGIEAPKAGGGLSSLSGIVGQVIGPKLQFLAPKLQAVSGLLGGAS